MGFSGSVNGTTKNPGFLDFGFCQCKWAYSLLYNAQLSIQITADFNQALMPFHSSKNDYIKN